jgi:hypothetical protein
LRNAPGKGIRDVLIYQAVECLLSRDGNDPSWWVGVSMDIMPD